MPRNGANNNGQVMRLSTAHTQQEEEKEGNPEAGNPEEGNPEEGNPEKAKSKLATSSRIYLLD